MGRSRGSRPGRRLAEDRSASALCTATNCRRRRRLGLGGRGPQRGEGEKPPLPRGFLSAVSKLRRSPASSPSPAAFVESVGPEQSTTTSASAARLRRRSNG
ncbi:Os09g0322850 [Oryza sativa Japonica Group]|uniref:Os09g0322850 protein n=4 Tax=Oryza TaxID=4527 RepID=B9G2V9_ORYSJ|nr:hypothetical protein OsI_30877 [Oryza sativa Indica Group]EEE69456.1 hypothetical protein OsJ_28858 [Oryza sativa Japonica Group]BAT07455.1 Os09g0322850 [Oryza sativa Japonica Group]